MEVAVLGPVEIADGGRRIHLPPKQRRLLAALAVEAGRSQTADLLIDAIWGFSPPASAAKLLTVYVSQLRKAVGVAAAIRTTGSGYALDLDVVSTDALRFERLVAEGLDAGRADNPRLAVSLLRRGLALWRGHAYGDLAYEDFARAEAERLEELRVEALVHRLDARLSLGEHEDSLPELARLAAEHPLHERLQLQTMLALYRCGRQSEALAFYTAVRRRLHAAGLEPSPELGQLQTQMLRHDDALTAPRFDDPPARALPAPANRLLGRAREVAELRELLLRDDVRFVTLVGAGGSGKTRLALAVAHEMAPSFANGAAFVSLAELRDPGLLVATIAQALEVPEVAGEDAPETLAKALRARDLLLVLDNAEHLRAATPMFVELLARAPRLTLLVTTRVVLHLSGERVYPVDPLDEEAAAALFVERARQADHRFAVDTTEAEVVRQICRRLDGLPLAIELAAAHMRTIRPSELLERLDRRLPLLAGGPRDVTARQRTLRATLEWSHELLDDEAKRDFARLSVFAGGCTLDVAEAVCETTIERISSLLDHNLVVRADSSQGTRYAMLETVREFAVERLEASGEAQALRRRQAEWVHELARTANVALRGGSQPASLERLSLEHANIRGAVDFALESRDAALALGIAGALGRYWPIRGHVGEAQRWLAAALAQADDVAADVLGAALYWQSDLAESAGDLELATAAAERALALASAKEDQRGIARSAFKLALARFDSDWAECERLLDEACAAARPEAPEVLAAVQSGGRGPLLLLKGEAGAAVAVLRDATAYFRSVSDTQNLAEAQVYLALALLQAGDATEVSSLLDQSLAMCAELRSPLFVGLCLQGYAALALHDDDPERAAGLLVRAEALFESINARLPGPVREIYRLLRLDVEQRVAGTHLAEIEDAAPPADLEDALRFAARASP